MINDDTNDIFIITGYEHNMLIYKPKEFIDFNKKNMCNILLFVSEGNCYKPNYKNNTWIKSNPSTIEQKIITKVKTINQSFIWFKINDDAYHKYQIIFKLLANINDLQICQIFGCCLIDCKTIKNGVVAIFDAENG